MDLPTAPAASPFTLLAVDDDVHMLEALTRVIARHGFQCTTYTSAKRALDAVRAGDLHFDVAMLDVSMPEMSGIDLLQQLRGADPNLTAVMLTGDTSSSTAVAAMMAGAANYISKPVRDFSALAAMLRGAACNAKLNRKIRNLELRVSRPKRRDLVGENHSMRELNSIVDRVAPLDITVLLTGESGTGKEMVARALHDRSPRAKAPFVAINCAAMPESLVDSELFGHVRGAFTGAAEAREGIFERAKGGTVFLDEIGDIPPSVQVRLLRVLQEREILRVGASSSTKIDVRVIAATHVDLEDAVAKRQFREDLYYRLNVVNVQLPALRHRGDDLGLLTAHFVQQYAQRLGRVCGGLEDSAIQAIYDYEWPGNVRELQNVVESAMALSTGGVIRRSDLPKRILVGALQPRRRSPLLQMKGDNAEWADGMNLTDARKQMQEHFERAYLLRLLRRSRGNISEAAREAGLDRSNFRRVMARCRVAPEDYLDGSKSTTEYEPR